MLSTSVVRAAHRAGAGGHGGVAASRILAARMRAGAGSSLSSSVAHTRPLLLLRNNSTTPTPNPGKTGPREEDSTDPVTSTIVPSADPDQVNSQHSSSISEEASRTYGQTPDIAPSSTGDSGASKVAEEVKDKAQKAGAVLGAVRTATGGSGGAGPSGAGSSTGSGSAGPPPPPRPGRIRKYVVRFARITLAVIVGGSGLIIYESWRARNPPDQLDHDPAKKTLVILGNGWGATSLLKNLDTQDYNVVLISPRNYFLFTPLLPSVTVGTLDVRSIIQPTRFVARHKKRRVHVIEAEADSIDIDNKVVTVIDNSELKGETVTTSVPYDYLVVAVGAENNTFGIKGVKDHACFLKEAWDAEKIRNRLMDCVETATFKDQTEKEIERLLHMVVVGGGPTGVEFAGELHDFLIDDLAHWYPEIAGKVKITLIEALPNMLPMFSKQLIEYTNATFKQNDIEVLTRTMVKDVQEKVIMAQNERKELIEIPYGLLVWAAGNTTRQIVRKLMTDIGEAEQNQRRGLTIDEFMHVKGAKDMWAIGDCVAGNWAPTAQAASQQGKYLGRVFAQLAKKEDLEQKLEIERQKGVEGRVEDVMKQLNRAARIKEFHYTHQGSLAYIGSEKAIADLPFFNGNLATGGVATMLFWRSAYISTLFSLRNRALVITDWMKVKIFGRDVSRE